MAPNVGLDAPAKGPVADDDQPRLRDTRAQGPVGAKQVTESLALLEPADEQDVQVLVSQVPDRRVAGLVDIDVDTVRDDLHIELGEVAVDERARRLADSDRAMQVAEVWLQERAAVKVADVGAREGME